MIPLHLKTDDFSEPDSPMYYLVAENGVYLVKNTGLYTSVTRACRIVGLEEQSPSLVLRLPKVPRKLLEMVYGFFAAVYRKWQGEAIVLLYYDPLGRTFRLGVPPQTLSRYHSCGSLVTEGRIEYARSRVPTNSSSSATSIPTETSRRSSAPWTTRTMTRTACGSSWGIWTARDRMSAPPSLPGELGFSWTPSRYWRSFRCRGRLRKNGYGE